jgi:hypothetical protein
LQSGVRSFQQTQISQISNKFKSIHQKDLQSTANIERLSAVPGKTIGQDLSVASAPGTFGCQKRMVNGQQILALNMIKVGGF